MRYATQDIIVALKSARKAKGLSQRALSKRTGVPQSHISKIESGGADIRLSSLTELARALDLDLKLVPRKIVPAVDGVVRATAPTVTATPAVKELNRTLDAVRDLRTIYPGLSELKRLQSGLHTLKNLRNVGSELEALRDVGKRFRKLQQTYKNLANARQGSAKQMEGTHDAANIPAECLEALRGVASTVQNLRNQLVHAQSEQPSLSQPAYRLGEDGERDDG